MKTLSAIIVLWLIFSILRNVSLMVWCKVKNDSFLYEQVKLNYPEAFSCSEKIKNYIESSHSRDEQVYITIHIQRLETSSN